jgi:hypothetical protein
VKRILIALALLLFAATLYAKDKKPKQEIPDEILTARYVAVIVFNESGQLMSQAEDLRSVGDVEAALRKWGRYAVTMNPRDADFVIAIRVDRMVGARIGTSTRNPGLSTETEVAPPGDMFAVYRRQVSGDPRDSAPVWRLLERGILQPPVVSAVQKFKKVVEESDQIRQSGKNP